MPERTSYEPGTPCWTDLSTADLGAAAAFYGGLFGWHARTEPDPAAGGYTLASLGGGQGRPVAGMMPAQAEGQPVVWTTYVSVADADEAAKAAEGAGGQVFMGPMDVLDQGRIALLADPSGASIGVWEPRTFPGAAVVDEPGAYTWSELACRDVGVAKEFYGTVFGWKGDTGSSGPMPYIEWENQGTAIGGMVEMGGSWPAEVAPHWTVYFAVADCGAAMARAVALGGAAPGPVLDVPAGRIAPLTDPQGGRFSIIQPVG